MNVARLLRTGLLAVAAVSSAAAPSAEPEAAAVAAAVNPFGLRVLSAAAATSPQDNVLVSPLSLSAALALLAEGAAGDTRTLLEQQLGLASAALPPTAVGVLGQQLTGKSEGSTLVIANGIWVAEDLRMEPAYVTTAKQAFAAAVEPIDFAAGSTLGRVNRWFAEQTAGKVPTLFATLDPGTRLVLGNALHFQGRWEQPFPVDRTAAAIFHAPGGAVEVPTMRQWLTDLGYRRSAVAQGIRLPFADARFDLTVILPEPGRILSELLGPDGAGLLDWLGSDWSSERVNVALPKFEIAVGGSLRQTLGEIGLQGLFAEADLGGISQEPLVVNEAVHRVVLAVDESGAEAAAATGFTVALSAAVPKREPVIFTVDRPFVVLIRHQPSQTLIVAGVINHPLAD